MYYYVCHTAVICVGLSGGLCCMYCVMWSNLKQDVEFQYGGRFWQMQWHVISVPRITFICMVLPFGEFTVMNPQPHATLQGVRIICAILRIVFRHIFFVFLFQFRL